MSYGNWKKYRRKNEDTKEYFCGACLMIPVAFAGIGASAYGASSRSKHKKQKKITRWLLFGGIATVIISILIWIYFKYIKKCTECGYTD